jgi:hypothetical protein
MTIGNWSSTVWPTIDTSNHWDKLSQDELLTMHLKLKQQVEKAKADEMELRKYIVNRAFPEKHEGTNTLELGNGYELKAGIKFNYQLADNDIVERTLDAIAKVGNTGPFIADRLVSWKPSFLLTEYRNLTDAAPHSAEAQEILALVGNMLTITDAAPTLEIKEPKAKKK